MEERILVLDGAMGTMIQRHDLEEYDFRKGAYENHKKPLREITIYSRLHALRLLKKYIKLTSTLVPISSKQIPSQEQVLPNQIMIWSMPFMI
jgi:hypothetical protein